MSEDSIDLMCSQIPLEVLDQSFENSLLIMIDADEVTVTPNEKSPLKDPEQCLELFGKKGSLKKKWRIMEWKEKDKN
jgi:hypothetical protein